MTTSRSRRAGLACSTHVRLEGGSLDLLEGKGQIVELVDDVVQAFVPIRAKDFVYEALDNGVDFAVEDGRVVGPGGDGSARFYDAAHLRVELVQVEPVDRGRHRHEIHGPIIEAGVLRLGYAVDDPGSARSLGDHLTALVGRHYPSEVTGQVRCGLAVARRAVPREGTRRHDGRQKREELVGVGGPEVDVLGRLGREGVLLHAGLSSLSLCLNGNFSRATNARGTWADPVAAQHGDAPGSRRRHYAFKSNGYG